MVYDNIRYVPTPFLPRLVFILILITNIWSQELLFSWSDLPQTQAVNNTGLMLFTNILYQENFFICTIITFTEITSVYTSSILKGLLCFHCKRERDELLSNLSYLKHSICLSILHHTNIQCHIQCILKLCIPSIHPPMVSNSIYVAMETDNPICLLQIGAISGAAICKVLSFH